MAARLLSDGYYEMEFPDGTKYRIPEEDARRTSPESFPEPLEDPGLIPPSWGSGPGGGGPEPEPEMVDPPWMGMEDPYRTDQADRDLALGRGQDESEMEFSEADAMGQPAQQSQMQSGSRSMSWSKPYQEAELTRQGEMPDYSPEARMAEDAYNMRREGIEEAKTGLGENMERQGELVEQRGEFNEATVAEQQRMYDETRAEVQRREEELDQRQQNVSRLNPKKIWQGADMQIAGFLSAGIAGFLNPTGKNSVIEQMAQLTEQEARKQEFNIGLEQDEIKAMKGSLGRYEQRGEDRETKYLANRAMLESSIIDQINFEKAKYSSIITLQKFDDMGAAALETLGKTRTELKQRNHNNIFQAKELRSRERQQAANRAAAAARMREAESYKLAREERAAKAAAEGGVSDRPSVGKFEGLGILYTRTGQKLSTGQKDMLTAEIAKSHNVRTIMNKVRVIIAKHGRASLIKGITKRERADKMMAEIGKYVKVGRDETGANITENEVKFIMGELGNPMKVLTNPEITDQILQNAIRGEPQRLLEKLTPLDLVVRRETDNGGYEGYDTEVKTGLSISGYDPVKIGKIIPQHLRPMVEDIEIVKASYEQRMLDGETQRAALIEPQIRQKADELLKAMEEYKITYKNDPELAEEIHSHLQNIEDPLGNPYSLKANVILDRGAQEDEPKEDVADDYLGLL